MEQIIETDAINKKVFVTYRLRFFALLAFKNGF